MAKKRVGIGAKKRFEIFKRDGFRCMYCGAHPPSVLLHVDHVKPVAEGGGNDELNLVTACERCNSGKGARPLSAIPESLESKATALAEKEAQLRGYQDLAAQREARVDEECWMVVGELMPGAESFNRKNLQSIRMFITRVGVYEVMDAARIAYSKHSGANMFPYFCGVCWNKIRKAESGEGV